MYPTLELFSIFRETEIACFNEAFCKSLANLLNVRTSQYLLTFLNEVDELGIEKKEDLFSKMIAKGVEQLRVHVVPKAHNLTLASELKKIPLGSQSLFEFLCGFNMTDGVTTIETGRLREFPHLKENLAAVLDKIPMLVAKVNAREKADAQAFLERCIDLDHFATFVTHQMQSVDYNRCFLKGTLHTSAEVGNLLEHKHETGVSEDAVYDYIMTSDIQEDDKFTIALNVQKYWGLPHDKVYKSSMSLKKSVKANMELFYSHRDVASTTLLGPIISKKADLQAFYNGICWNEYCSDARNKVGILSSILCAVPKDLSSKLEEAY